MMEDLIQGYGGEVGPCRSRLRFVAAGPEFIVMSYINMYLQSIIITRWRCDDYIWKNLDGFPLDYPAS